MIKDTTLNISVVNIDTMDPIIVDDCQILGKVYGVFRMMR